MHVHALSTGTVQVHENQRAGRGPGPLRFLNTVRDSVWSEPLPILLWVIEHPEGLIVIDTGETARVHEPGYLPAWHPYYRYGVRFDVGPEEEAGPRLRSIGLSTDDVRWVVMTHLHTDHAGGLAHFRKSHILVSREEQRAASGPLGRLRGYLPHRWPRWFAPAAPAWSDGPFGPFPESHRLTRAGDVRLVRTVGHSAGHISVMLEEDDGTVIFFAGDASYTEDLMLHGTLDGVSSMGGGLAAARLSLERIRRLATSRGVVYLPSHDPESPHRLAERQVVSEAVALRA